MRHANLSLKVANHDHVEQLFLAEVWGFPKGSKPLVCDCFQVQKLRKRDTWRRHPVDTTWRHLATWLQSSRCWDSAWLSSLCRLLRYTESPHDCRHFQWICVEVAKPEAQELTMLQSDEDLDTGLHSSRQRSSATVLLPKLAQRSSKVMFFFSTCLNLSNISNQLV